MPSQLHRLSCAFLNLARDVLEAGLEKQLQNALMKKKTPTSSSELCRITAKILISMWDQIRSSIENLITRYHCDYNVDDIYSQISIQTDTLTGLAASTKLSEIATSKNGRSLITSRGVGKGNTLTSERPFIVNIKSKCKCMSNNILTEHVNLALCLYLEYANNSSFHAANEHRDFDFFLCMFQSGLCDDVMAGNEAVLKYTSASTEPLRQWVFHDQCILICVSIISVLYSTHCLGVQLQGSRDSRLRIVSGSNEQNKIMNASWSLLQILSRLPTNTHAIMKVMKVTQGIPKYPVSSRNSFDKDHSRSIRSSSDEEFTSTGLRKEEQLEEKRLGFAVFLMASSVNHSCRPNSAVRYNFPLASSSIESSPLLYSPSHLPPAPMVSAGVGVSMFQQERAALLAMLSSVYLDVVALCSIPNSAEITISYGPLAGAHNMALRQRVLRQQYLFACTCDACDDESDRSSKQQRNSTTGVGITAHKRDSGCSSELGLASFHSAHAQSREFSSAAPSSSSSSDDSLANVRDSIHLCTSLEECRGEAAILTVELTEVFNVHRQSGAISSSERRSSSRSSSVDSSLDYRSGRSVDTVIEERDFLAEFEVLSLQPIRGRLLKLRERHFGLPAQLLSPQLRTAYDNTSCASSSFSPGERDSSSRGPTTDLAVQEVAAKLFHTGSPEAQLYTEFCAIYCLVLDMSAHVAAKRAEYGPAADWVAEAIYSMVSSGAYTDDDIVIARERVKLAQLLMSCGQLQACRRVVERALMDITPYVGADDPDYVEAVMIQQFLTK